MKAYSWLYSYKYDISEVYEVSLKSEKGVRKYTILHKFQLGP